MRKSGAILGSVVFFLVAPATVAGLVPFWLTRWQVNRLPFGVVQQLLGGLLIVVGAGVLVHAFARFALEGLGTPAPVAPTERLVVGGFYRHVRNPMYLAVTTVVFGQALVLGQRSLVEYGIVLFVAFAVFVRVYEEPTLAEQFGAEYDAYRSAVPAWWPRLRPWQPDRESTRLDS